MNAPALVTNSYGTEWPKPVQSSEYYEAMNRHEESSTYYHYLSEMLNCPSLCLVVSAHPPGQKSYLANAVGLVLGQDVVKSDLELKFRIYSAGNTISESIVTDLESIIGEGGTSKVICLSRLPACLDWTELDAFFLNLKKLVEDNLVTIIVCLEMQKTSSFKLQDLRHVEPYCDLICEASMPTKEFCEEEKYVDLSLLKNRFGEIPMTFRGPWPFLEISDVGEDYWNQIT